jgi:hypothetical protein
MRHSPQAQSIPRNEQPLSNGGFGQSATPHICNAACGISGARLSEINMEMKPWAANACGRRNAIIIAVAPQHQPDPYT